MQKSTGRHRIQSVALMTGVPAATLRSWERRYGLPRPNRTKSAYRLYNDAEVELIRRMKAMCDQGLAASEAAARLLEPGASPSSAPGEEPLAATANRLVDAALAYDTVRLQELLRGALTLGDAITVFERVITPALVRLGDLWQRGEASVGQEHLLAEACEYTARDLLRLVQPPATEPAVLLACFPDEQHVLGLYGVGVRLAAQGVRSILLGARTPIDALAQAVHHVEPVLVGLSVTIPPPADEARQLLAAVAEAAGGTPWAVGGGGVGPIAALVEQAGGAVIHPWPDGIHDVVRAAVRRAPSSAPRR